MSEYTLQLIAFLKLIWMAVFALWYGLGGINNKWVRRFIAPCWMMLGIFGFSQWQGTWNLWYLLFLPIAIGGLHNGYGASKLIDKIRRRAVYGLILSFSAIPIVALSHLWTLFGVHVGLAVLSSTLFGTFNPFRSARDEETVIATGCFLLTLFLI